GGLDEGHGGRGRDRDETLAELDEAFVAGGVDLAEGGGAVGEEGVGLAADAAGDAGRELEVGGALRGGDGAQELRAALAVEGGLSTGEVGDVVSDCVGGADLIVVLVRGGRGGVFEADGRVFVFVVCVVMVGNGEACVIVQGEVLWEVGG